MSKMHFGICGRISGYAAEQITCWGMWADEYGALLGRRMRAPGMKASAAVVGVAGVPRLLPGKGPAVGDPPGLRERCVQMLDEWARLEEESPHDKVQAQFVSQLTQAGLLKVPAPGGASTSRPPPPPPSLCSRVHVVCLSQSPVDEGRGDY